MKKKLLLGLIALGCLTMSGCSMRFEKDGIHLNDQESTATKQTTKKESKKSNNKPEKQKQTIHKSQKNKENNKSKKDETIWSAKQDKELEKFVLSWSKSMGQKYEKYVGKNIKTSSGTIYPSALSKRRFLLNKKTINIGWNPNGKKKFNYNVVAIYNDNLKTRGMHITYLFTIKDKRGIVLVDEGKNANPLILRRSNNSRLNKQFEKIVVRDR